MIAFKAAGKWYVEKSKTARTKKFRQGSAYPLNVEFETRRIEPSLKPYAELVRKAYLEANHRYWGHDVVVMGVDDNDLDSLGVGYIVPEAVYNPTANQGQSRTGADLIASLTSTVPIDRAKVSTDPLELIGPEIGAQGALICQRLLYSARQLYDPMINAVVFRHTMVDIGKLHGGNSVNSAAIGREKVRDGLLFAKKVFDDLAEEECRSEQTEKESTLRLPHFALGKDADAFSAKWRQAVNDNRRRIADVA
jgi:hypothetical protein